MNCNGSSCCGSNGGCVSHQITRSGDYLLQTMIRIKLPAISGVDLGTDNGGQAHVAWVPNVGHQIIERATLLFNDLKLLSELNSHVLDCYAAFMVSDSQRKLYNEMIGMVPELTEPSVSKEEYNLIVPMPYLTCGATGAGGALSTQAGASFGVVSVPYNDILSQITLTDLSKLIVTVNGSANGTNTIGFNAAQYVVNFSNLKVQTQLWANYSVVSNPERKMMVANPKDHLLDHWQHTQSSLTSPSTTSL